MTELIGGLLWASVAGTVIAALLATIVGMFIRLQRPAASTRCTLWLIVLSTSLLAPAVILAAMNFPSVRSSMHAGAMEQAKTRGARSNFEQAVRVRGGVFAPRALLQRPTLSRNVANVIASLWLGGALIGCFGLLRSVTRVRALKRRSSPLEGSLPDDLPWLTQRPGREIYLRLSYEIETPIAIGFRRPVILIPTEMATLAGLAAIEPLVMHEYAHLARYDDWTNLWQRVVERLAFWNPLVWYAGERLALEREVAADDAVVQRTRDATQYARALWRLAREMRMPEHVVVAPGAMLTRKQISIRIERLLDDSATPRRYAGVGLALAAIAVSTVAAVASSAPRFNFTRLTTHDVGAQLFLPPTMRSVTSARAIATPIRRAPSRATERATIVHVTRPAVAMLVAQTMPSMRPVKAATPAPTDVRSQMLGPYHSGCMGCSLQNADLHGQDFRGAHFQGTNMQNADLHGANLRNAVLSGVNLENANLDGADLRGAQLTGTNLSGASMRGTLITGISLMGTSLP